MKSPEQYIGEVGLLKGAYALTAAGVLYNQLALRIDHSNCLTKLYCVTVFPLWLTAAGEEEVGRQPPFILLPRLLGAHIPTLQSPKPKA